MAPALNEDSLLARHRQLAPAASIRVSPLCLGSMNFGLAHAHRTGHCTKETAFAMLDHFHSEGGNFVDTANSYHDGETETWLGEWMADRGVRDQMVLATKFTSSSRAAKPGVIMSNFAGNNAKSMRVSVDQSLRRLQTNYVDILYVHWWEFTTTVPELMHALNDLVAAGKVLYLGVSDTPAWVVTKANAYARGAGLRPFVVYQGLWNAALRDFEREIIPMCADEGMALAPFGVLGHGHFQTEAAFREREADNPGRKSWPVSDREKQVSKVLETVATRKGVGLHQVALAYVAQKVPYVFPIVGGRKMEHLQGAVDGLAVALTADEIDEIERAYDFDHGFPHSFMSGTAIAPGTPSKGCNHPADSFVVQQAGKSKFDWVAGPVAIRPPPKS